MTIPVHRPEDEFVGQLPTSQSLPESRYVSRYGVETLGLNIRVAGVPYDPPAPPIVLLWGLDDEILRHQWPAADLVEPGSYVVALSSAQTAESGAFIVEWKYDVNGSEESFVGYIEVGPASPTYDGLSDGFKGVVESALIRFGDTFDSPHGGPHLSVYYQTNFGRERVAQLLKIALGRLNTVSQPRTVYTVDPDGKEFPFAQWGPLLEQALYIECLKHLIRSYVEQPDAVGVVVSRLDRRDYMNRWQTVLNMEQQDLKDQMDGFKIAHMGLGSMRLLAAGGAYGKLSPFRSTSMAGQPRFWSRFY